MLFLSFLFLGFQIIWFNKSLFGGSFFANLLRHSFAHDRFANAVATLRECHNAEEMNFVIAQTMMKYYHDEKHLYTKARHICQCAEMVKSRVKHRANYRKVLWDAGQMAIRSGARPTALYYYTHCIDLLQPDCWKASAPDVDYYETVNLHNATAELYWFQGQGPAGMKLLDTLFAHAMTGTCKAKAWILKSKIFAQGGDHKTSMKVLLTGLDELGMHFDRTQSIEGCDAAFSRLHSHLLSINLENAMLKPLSEDKTIVAIGSLMGEMIAVAIWGEPFLLLCIAIEMVNLHLFKGGVGQIAIGCAHLASMAYCRYKEPDFANRLGDLSVFFQEEYTESWSRATALCVQIMMVEHLRVPLRSSLPSLENAVDLAFTSDDPQLMLISFSCMAICRLFLGQDLSALESFCTDVPEELDVWAYDTRGGVFLTVVK